MLPECLMFFSFLRSRGGSVGHSHEYIMEFASNIERFLPLRALMTREDAEGTTATWACRFWMVSSTVTRRPFQADVALAISSPTFFGDYTV
jgi:hypothetical protein